MKKDQLNIQKGMRVLMPFTDVIFYVWGLFMR